MTQAAGLLRTLYPGAENAIYLDSAAVGITSMAVREAMLATVVQHERFGRAGSVVRDQTMTRTRQQAAELVHGRPDRIAFTQNTSTGIALVVNGVDWRSGDNVVVPAGEFPSNFYPWTQLRQHGVEVREIPMVDGHADSAAASRLVDARTRVLSISAVQYSSGFRYLLAEFSDLCHRSEALFVVDGTQSVGAMTIDAAADGIDVLAVSAHKWMLGPLGIGFVHLSERAMNALSPSVVGWLSVADPFAFDHEPRLAEDARRFESGTENAAGIAGLGASIEHVVTLGPDAVETHVLNRTQELAELLRRQGWGIVRHPDRHHWSGILIAAAPADNEVTHAKLQAEGVRCSLRGSGIRFSPHYFTSTADLERVAEIAAGVPARI